MTIDYKQFPAFQNLDESQLQSFINACKGAMIPAGQQILLQNLQGQKIFFVLDGQVRVFLDTQTGEKELAKIAAPTVLGEISFFSGEPNSANVTTVTPIRTLVMPFEQLRQRLHKGDAAASIVVLNMAGAIARASIGYDPQDFRTV